MDYHSEYSSRIGFLEAQYELCKLELVETHNDKYFELMQELRKTIDFLKNLDNAYKKSLKKS